MTGLPAGLSFDPLTRTVSGTPTTAGGNTVTYTVDDADNRHSEGGHLNDAARQTFDIVIAGAAPVIESLDIVSTPSIDADNNGTTDTYGVGETIAVEATFNEAVTVTGNNDVKLRLDLGTDDADLSNSRKVLRLHSVSGNTLRFEYTVAAADTDADGVWIQTLNSSSDQVLFLGGSATIRDADANNALLTKHGQSGRTSGNPLHKVDGSRAPAGPPTAPGAPTVTKGSTSGALAVSWTAPAGTITDYDLRYFKGSADPTGTEVWVSDVGKAGGCRIRARRRRTRSRVCWRTRPTGCRCARRTRKARGRGRPRGARRRPRHRRTTTRRVCSSTWLAKEATTTARSRPTRPRHGQP